MERKDFHRSSDKPKFRNVIVTLYFVRLLQNNFVFVGSTTLYKKLKKPRDVRQEQKTLISGLVVTNCFNVGLENGTLIFSINKFISDVKHCL